MLNNIDPRGSVNTVDEIRCNHKIEIRGDL